MASQGTPGAGGDRLARLCRAAQALNGVHELEPVLRLIVASAAEVSGARYAALATYDDAGQIQMFVHHGLDGAAAGRIGRPPAGRGLLGAAIVADGPIRSGDVAADPRACGFPARHPQMRTFLGVPVIRGGRRYGNLYLCEKTGGAPFDRDDEEALVTLGAFAAGAIQTAELIAAERERAQAAEALAVAGERQRQRDELGAAAIAAQEAERARVARDLHDQVGQGLTAVLLALRLVADAADRRLAGRGEARQRIAETRDLVVQALRDVQEVASGLRPAALDDLGLAAALERLADEQSARHGIPIDLAFEGTAGGLRLTAEREIAAYRVVQEALTNAARHASAERVTVTVSYGAGMLRAAVEDDGTGFDPAAAAHHSLGLAGMRERLAMVGGALSIESQPGRGTRILAEVPGD